MWTVQIETLSDRALRFAVLRDAKPATVSDVIRGWQADESFRRAFNGTSVPASAGRGWTRRTMSG